MINSIFADSTPSGYVTTILIMVLLIFLSGFFSATETAFSALNTTRMKSYAEKGDRRASKTLALSEKYDKLLSTILIGNNLVNIILTAIGTVFFVGLLGEGIGVTISTVVITVAVLIFGEITPKNLAKESPEKFAMFATPVIKFLMIILTPVNFIFSLWKKLISKVFKVEEDHGMTSDEFITLIDAASEGGEMDSEETELIKSAVEFNDLVAEDIITPRVDVIGVSDTTSKEEIAQIFTVTGYSRLPVYKDSLDNITGVVHQKDFYDGPSITSKPLSEIIKTPVFVTPSMKIRYILRLLQKTKSHIAFVTDEYGGTLGIVTMEDILEELVGEIWDEHDEVVEEIVKLDEETYRIKCSVSLDEMFELFDLPEDEESDSNTVSGWVMEKIGRIPLEGDSFEYNNLHVTVTSTDNQRVLEIKVIILPRDDEEEDEEN